MPWPSSSNNSVVTPRGAQGPTDLDSFGAQESPHMYLLSPSDATQPQNGNDSFMDSGREMLDKKEGELVALRHKYQCLEKYKHDLMDEVKQLQEDNETLIRKLEDSKKESKEKERECKALHCKAEEVFPSYVEQVETVDCRDSKFSELLEEFRKTKLALTQSEDKCFTILQKLEEASENIRKRDIFVKELQEANGIMQKEISHILDTKQTLQAKIDDKESLIENLESHCLQLTEKVSYLSNHSSGRKNSNGLSKHGYPNLSLSLNDSFNFSMKDDPIDLGHEVIDVQWRETKDVLERTEEKLKECEEVLQIKEETILDLTQKLHDIANTMSIKEDKYKELQQSEEKLLLEQDQNSVLLAQLNITVEQLQLQLQELQSDKQQRQKELLGCRERLASTEGTLADRSAGLEMALLKLSEAESEIKVINLGAKKLESQLKEAETFKSEVEEQLKACKEVLKIKEETMLDLTQTLKELTQSKEKLLLEQDQNSILLAQLNITVEQLQLQLQELQSDKRQRQEELLCCRERLTSTEGTLADRAADLEMALLKLSEAETEIQVVNLSAGKLESQLQEARHVNQAVELRCMNLEQDLHVKIKEALQAEKFKSEVEAKWKTCEEVLQIKEENILDLAQKLHDAKNTISVEEDKYKDLKQSEEKLLLEHNQKSALLTQLNINMEQLQLQLQELQSDNQQRHEEIVCCRQKLHSTEGTLADQTADLEMALLKLSQAENEIKVVNLSAEKLESQLQEAQKFKSEVEEKLKACEEGLQIKEETMLYLTQTLKELKQSEEKLLLEHDQKSVLLAQLNITVEQLQLQLQELESDKQQRQEELVCCKERLAITEGTLSDRAEDLEIALLKLSEAASEIKVANVTAGKLESQLQEARQVSEAARLQCMSLEQDLQYKITEALQADTFKSELESKLKACEELLQIKEETILDWTQKLHDAEKIISLQEDKYKELQQSEEKLLLEQDQNAVLLTQLNITVEQLQLQLQEHISDKQQRQEELLCYRERLATVEGTLADTAANLEVAVLKLSEADSEIKVVNVTAAKLESQLKEAETFKSEVEEKLKACEEGLQIKEETILDFIQKLHDAENTISVKKDEFEELKQSEAKLLLEQDQNSVLLTQLNITVEQLQLQLQELESDKQQRQEELVCCKERLAITEGTLSDRAEDLEIALLKLSEAASEIKVANVTAGKLESQLQEARQVSEAARLQSMNLEQDLHLKTEEAFQAEKFKSEVEEKLNACQEVLNIKEETILDFIQKLRDAENTISLKEEKYKELKQSEEKLLLEQDQKSVLLTQLNINVEQLQLQLQELQSDKQQRQEELLRCKEKLASTEGTLADRAADLEIALLKLSEAESEIQVVNVTAEKLELQIQEAEKLKSEVEEKFTACQEVLNIKEEAILNLTQKLQDAVKIISVKEDEYKELKQSEAKLLLEQDQKSGLLTQLNITVEELQLQLQDLQSDIQQRQEELLRCKERLASTEGKLADRAADLEMAVLKLSETESEMKVVNSSAEKLESQLQEAEKIKSKVEEKLKACEEVLKIKEEAMLDLTQTLKELKESEEKLLLEQDQNSVLLTQLNINVEQLQLQLQELQYDKQQRQEELLRSKDRLASVEGTLADTAADLEVAVLKLLDAESEIKVVNVTAGKLVSELQEAEKLKSEVETKFTACQEVLKINEGTILNLTQKLHDTEKIISVKEEKYKVLKQSEEKLLLEQDQNSVLLSQLNITVEQLQLQLQELLSDKQQRQEELRCCRERLASTEGTLADRSAGLEMALLKLSEAENEIKIVNSTVGNLESQLKEAETFKSEIEEKLKACEEGLQIKEETILDFIQKLHDAENTISVKKDELEELKQSEAKLLLEQDQKSGLLTQLNITVEQLQLQLQELQSDKQQRQEELLCCRERLASTEGTLSDRAADLEIALLKLSEAKSEIKVVNSSAGKLESQLQEARQVGEAARLQCMNLEQDLHLKTEEAFQAEKFKCEVEEKLIACEEVLKIKEETMLDLTQKLHDAESIVSVEEDKYKELKQSEEKLLLEQDQNSILLTQLNVDVEQLKLQLQELQSDKQQRQEELLWCKERLASTEGTLADRAADLEMALLKLSEAENEIKVVNLSAGKLEAQLQEARQVNEAAKLQFMNLEQDLDLKIKEAREAGMHEVKGKYTERCEKFKSEVADILKEETGKSDKLKTQLNDATSRAEIAEEQLDNLKREMGQLRRDYLEVQSVIHVLQTSIEKQQKRIKELEDPSKHSFAAPTQKSSSSLHHSHQLSDSTLVTRPKMTTSTLVTSRSFGNFNSALRKSPEHDTSDRRLSSISIASTSSNTSTSSGRFKAVPTGSGSLFKCEDEDEFQFQEKNIFDLKNKRQIGSVQLPGIQGPFFDLDERPDRFSELYRRNTMVPPHMKSCYPSEYITCDNGEVDENKLKGMQRSVSGPVTSSIKQCSVIHSGAPLISSAAVRSVHEKRKESTVSNRKPFRNLQHP